MYKIIILLICAFAFHTKVFSQAETKKTETFKVYGNCDQCKSNIEGSLKKKDGVSSKEWNSKTKMLTVTYDASKITRAQIEQKVADVGYDTDAVKAKDETYNKLHKCCQYDRPKAN
jgi:mercuric ion binding protein